MVNGLIEKPIELLQTYEDERRPWVSCFCSSVVFLGGPPGPKPRGSGGTPWKDYSLYCEGGGEDTWFAMS